MVRPAAFEALAIFLSIFAIAFFSACGGADFTTQEDHGQTDSSVDSSVDQGNPDTNPDVAVDVAADSDSQSDVLLDPTPELGDSPSDVDAQLDADAGETATDALILAVSLSPKDFDFGPLKLQASSSPKEFLVSNTGSVALTSPAVTAMGAHASDFLLESSGCAGVASLQPGDSCAIKAVFRPSQKGLRQATMLVLANGQVATSEMRGTGIVPSSLTIAPSPYSFGSITVGTVSASASFTIANMGGGTSQALQVGLMGANSSVFAITQDSCTTAVLAPGGTCTVAVSFNPTVEGSQSAQLQLSENGQDVAQANISGEATASGTLVISPTSANLGSSAVQVAGDLSYFTVSNGNAVTGALKVMLDGTDSADFEITDNKCVGTLQAKQSCQIGVRLNPKTVGTKSASLSVAAMPGGSATSALSGKALRPAKLVLSPNSQSFGTVAVNQESATFGFEVVNQGEAASGTGAALINGPDASSFSIKSSTCTKALDPSEKCTVTVVYKPSKDGAQSAVLHVSATPGDDATSALSGSGGTSALTLTPTSGAFTASPIAQKSNTLSFELKNQGTVASGAIDTQITGSNKDDFVVELPSECATSLAPQGSCKVNITFTPSARGTRNGTLSISASPGGNPVAALTGVGLGPAQLAISPDSTNFGSQSLNTTSSSVNFTVKNIGDMMSGVPTVALTGAAQGDYSITNKAACGQSLDANATCTVSVAFNPTISGTRTASLSIQATPGGSIAAGLTGIGTTQAALSLSPSSNTFAATPIGVQSSAVEFTLTNTGGSVSGAIAIALGDSTNFLVLADSCSNVTLASGVSCKFSIAFKPTVEGTTNSLVTANASPGNSVSASLSGYGQGPAKLTITPVTNDFGNIAVNSSSVAATFTVKNVGAQNTATISTALSGAAGGDYALGPNTCVGTSLIPNATCTVGVTFKPTALGTRLGNLAVSATTTTASAEITGVGVPPAALTISPQSMTFADVAFGQQSSATVFTVTNAGGVVSGNIAVALSPWSTPFQLLTNTCSGVALAAGAFCTISAVYAPNAYGPATAQLGVSATPGNAVAATLTGNTPDVFVGINGDDSLEGFVPTAPVASIGRAIVIVNKIGRPNWTIHLGSGTFGKNETFPISIPVFTTLVGNTDLSSIIESGTISPSVVVDLGKGNTILRYVRVKGNSSLMGTSDNQTVVQIPSSDGSIEGCIIDNPSSKSTGIEILGNRASVSNTTINQTAISGLGIRMASSGASIPPISLVSNTIVCSSGNGLLIEGNSPASINGMTIQNCITGISITGVGASVTLRNSSITGSRNGVMVSATPSIIDLGTQTTPGKNKIISTTASAVVGLNINLVNALSSFTVYASGNTWKASVQGADAAGKYTPGTTVSGPVIAVLGNNYAIAGGAGFSISF